MKKWISEQQADIIHADEEEVIVNAGAGTGKTFTILEYMLANLDKNMRYLVFNKFMEKSISNKIKYNPHYTSLDRENIKTSTLHKFMRDTLSQKFDNIQFDYTSGELTKLSLSKVLAKMNVSFNPQDQDFSSLLESFNNYIRPYLITTMRLEDFNKSNAEPFVSTSVLAALRGFDSIKMSYGNDKTMAVKEIFNQMLNGIMNKEHSFIIDSMPHSVYYKFVYEHYKNENIFDGEDVIIVDEGQDIDPLILELIKTSKSKVMIFGDYFQQINRFRGTVNGLMVEKKNAKVYPLNMSYRITPYQGLILSAYLQSKSEAMQIENTPNLYGAKYKSEDADTKAGIKELSKDEFIKNAIKDIESIDLETNSIIVQKEEMREKYVSSIRNGSKMMYKAALIRYKKENDSLEFIEATKKYTTIFESNLFKKDFENDYEIFNQIKDGAVDNQEAVKNIAYRIHAAFTSRLTNKQKKEILCSEGVSAYLTKSNKNAMDFMLKFVKEIPYDLDTKIPKFNIDFNLSTLNKLDEISKYNFDVLSIKQFAGFEKALYSITSDVSGLSVYDTYIAMKKMPLPAELIKAFLSDDISEEKKCGLVDIPVVHINNKKVSFSDLGASYKDIKVILSSNIRGLKTILKREPTLQEILKRLNNNITGIIRFDKLLYSQTCLDEILATGNKTLESIYKYREIKNIVKDNPNISMASPDQASNFVISTVHGSKGLEFERVLLGNDISCKDTEDMQKVRDEVNVAYVAFTRSADTSIEEGSELYEELNGLTNYKRGYVSTNNDAVIYEGIDSNSNAYMDIVFTNGVGESLKIQERYMKLGEFPSYKSFHVITDQQGNKQVLQERSNDSINILYSDPLFTENDKDNKKAWFKSDEMENVKIAEEKIKMNGKKIQKEIDREVNNLF